MMFDVSRPFAAHELFKLVQVGTKQGKPDFMNLRATRRPGRAIAMEQLTGAGIYGLFLHGKLYYVGIFAGATEDPLAGSVLVRWKKHLTYQALRSPEVCFSRANLGAILGADANPPFDSIADVLGGRAVDRNALNPDAHPLLQRHGGSCTYAKARFAARNWDVFRPGQEAMMGEAVTFVFARLKPQALSGAAPMDKAHRKWIKHQWLGRCERILIDSLKPICNAETPIGAEGDYMIEDFVRELAGAAASPFPPYIPLEITAEAPVANSVDHELSTAPADEHIEAVDAAEDVDLDGMDPGEQKYRDRLSLAGETFVDELDELLPVGIAMNFTKVPDLRLHQEPGHHVLLTVSPTRRHGGMAAKVGADLSIAHALGFTDAVSSGDGQWVDFTIDPSAHQPSALLALAGAAMKKRG